ncbi:hypothetical protein [Hyphomonas sp.]|jgi:hypothetical protein|uniref:hypothetical protein n=3 Tax=Hyphomonas TaxID=85 RepID=UPI002631D328|nr:hypothetical protein [Hyphomonas sp.]MDF1804971.1 hypothetical protein [Hyphomonas sp.]
MLADVRRTAFGSACIALAACVNHPTSIMDQATANCGAPIGWEQVATAAEARVLIFGETHGTNEIPDTFARYVCAASARGGKTLVLLEIDASYADAFAAASDADDPRAELLSKMSKHWASTDGRASEAILEMMESLIELRQSGRALTIRPMAQMVGWPEMDSLEKLAAWLAEQPPTKIQQMGEDGLAEIIRTESEGFDRTIVLVGNVHARKAELTGLPGVQLMAMLVPDSISLIVLHDGGTSWSKTNGEARITDVFKTNAMNNVADSMAVGPEKQPAYPGDVPNFDGYVSVGAITASSPAMPSAETP